MDLTNICQIICGKFHQNPSIRLGCSAVTHRHTDTHTDTHTHRHTDTKWHTDRQTDRQTFTDTHTHSQTLTDTHRQYVNMSLFIYVTIHLGRGVLREISQVSWICRIFYTFPKNQYIHHFLLLQFQHQGLQCSARCPHLTSTLELAELNKYSNNKWQGPALLVRSEIF